MEFRTSEAKACRCDCHKSAADMDDVTSGLNWNSRNGFDTHTTQSFYCSSRFTGARDSEWQWHLLGYMQVCTSSQITMPTSHHSVFYRPDALLPPNQQRQSTEGNMKWLWMTLKFHHLMFACSNAISLSAVVNKWCSYCGCSIHARICDGVIACSYLALNFCFSALSSRSGINLLSSDFHAATALAGNDLIIM